MSDTREERIDEILAAYLATVEAGTPMDRAAWLAQHPDIADELRVFLDDREQFARFAEVIPLPAGLADQPTLGPGTSADGSPVLVRYFGDYELLEEIARGGMGVVYKARQVSLQRIVALKMILTGQFAGEEEVQRFLREARTAANLRHPHIVPIHEVGQHNGQHYFSMDFIEGQSLADLVRDRPLPPADAARLLVPVARAIHFAHQQGVLHRDLKPSNVLLDPFHRPLVTDFGLAKQITTSEHPGNPLTATGAVLGTPGYMPPEQASGKHGDMGPASDVYSLGAILYELVTGRPPFRAATPLDTLLQVLDARPAPPRLLNPAISRDLETILLKCLTKEPARRYASAEDLAGDLEAFLDGRPIKARRPGLRERSGRWAWRHRGRLIQAGVVAVLSIVLVLGGWQVWSRHADAQLGRVEFKGEPGLSAEVLAAADARLVVPRFALPREDPIALPEGDYLVRLLGARQVSETAQLRVLRGDRQEVSVAVRPRWETPQLRWSETHKLVNFGDRFGVVGFDRSRLHLYRIDAFAGWKEPAWEMHLPVDLINRGVKAFGYTKPMLQVLEASSGQFLGAPADLDGDGTRDLLWTGMPQQGDTLPFTGLLALSGKTGQPLWHTEVVPAPPPQVMGKPHRYLSGRLQLNEPVVIGKDSSAAVITAIHAWDGQFHLEPPIAPKEPISTGIQRWVHAFSARDGQTLWRFPLNNAWFAKDEDKPVGPFPVTAAGKPYLLCLAGTHLIVLDPRTGKAAWPVHELPAPPNVRPRLIERGPGEAPLLLCQTGSWLSGFLFPDGQVAWPARDLGFTPLREAQVPQGKSPPVLLLHQGPRNVNEDKQTLQLSAHDLQTGTVTWERLVQADWNRQEAANPLLRLVPEDMRNHGKKEIPPVWPLVNDRGNGAFEVLVPGRDRTSEWVWLESLDGRTGEVRWQKRWKSNSSSGLRQPDQFVFGPDLDGDGHREVFVASFGRKHLRPGPDQRSVYWHHLFVHALSGKDGRTLWTWDRPIRHTTEGRIGSLLWWQPGADGWPQIVVPYSAMVREGGSTTFVLTTGTGRLAHEIGGLTEPRIADLDGDGRPDLYQSELVNASSWDGQRWTDRVVAFRGERGQAWRRLGIWTPKADFDGDGINDLLGTSGKQTLAISGKDGRVLWQLPEVPGNLAVPHPYLSLVGDGVPDLIGVVPEYGEDFDPSISKRCAVSGRTGRKLWAGGDAPGSPAPDPLLGGGQATMQNHPELPRPECHDLLGDGRGVVLYPYIVQHKKKEENPKAEDAQELADMVAGALLPDRNELCLTAVRGHDGSVLWRQVLARQETKELTVGCGELRFQVADLDGDGVKEVVCLVRGPDGKTRLETREGSDGTVRWQLPLEVRGTLGENGNLPLLLTADLDGDTRSKVYLVEWINAGRRDRWQVRALSRDGKTLWTWQSAWAAGGLQTHVGGALAVVARLKDIGPALCLSLLREAPGNHAEATLVVLDGRGRARQQIVTPIKSGRMQRGFLQAANLHGDGHDDLVWRIGDEDLFVTRGGFDRAGLVWQDDKVKWLNGLASLGPGRPDRLRRDQRLLDGRNGRLVLDLGYHKILPVRADAGHARLLDSSGSVCYVVPLMEDGTEKTFWGEPCSYGPEVPDPRLASPLPWVEGRAYGDIAVAGLLTLLWPVVPLLLVILAWRKRSWRWGIFAALAVGIALTAWLGEWIPAKPRLLLTVATFDELWEVIDEIANQGHLLKYGPPFVWLEPVLKPLAFKEETRLFRIALGLPLAVWALAFCWCLARQRWRLLGLLIAVTLLSAAVFAAVDLWQAGALDSGEYYTWNSWYLAFLPGAYLAGMGLLLIGAVLAVIRGLRWLCKRGRRLPVTA